MAGAGQEPYALPDAAMVESFSFHRELVALRRERTVVAAQDEEKIHPHSRLSLKLRNYELALSHGIEIPRILASWLNPHQIRLDDFPEFFVLKSDGGASGAGVLPLQRVSDDGFQVVGRADILTRSEVIARLTQRYKAKQAYGVVFAEEFIAAPTGQVIPPDLKFYTSYGSILQVLMRSVTRLRDESAVSMGYFSSEGTALGKVAQTDQFGAPSSAVGGHSGGSERALLLVSAIRWFRNG